MNEYKMTAKFIQKCIACFILLITSYTIKNYLQYKVSMELATQQMSINGGSIYYDIYTANIDLLFLIAVSMIVVAFATTLYKYITFRKDLKK